MWGHGLWQTPWKPKGPYLVIWAGQSGPERRGRNAFLVTRSAGQTALPGLRGSLPEGGGKERWKWGRGELLALALGLPLPCSALCCASSPCPGR